MNDVERLTNLKYELNMLYGRPVYELKTPMYVKDTNKNLMEEIDMAMDYTIQQKIYNALWPTSEVTTKKTEETDTTWVWVTGYKGLDRDMKAHGDFQYEMDELYIMPEGEPVEACRGGFHLCLNLKDLYNDYKHIEKGNRFFECRALVRESDLKEYGKYEFYFKKNKLAAKSIRLVRELTVDEILEPVEDSVEWPQYIKEMAINENLHKARVEMKVFTMTRMGYARPLAEYICNDRNSEDGYKLAVALDSQTDISMDTKINAIFSHI